MKTRVSSLAVAAILLCGAVALLLHYRVVFEWGVFWKQIAQVSSQRILLATGLIYLSVSLRAWRWATLLKGKSEVATTHLIGPQYIGFSCVALFGSVGDLVRPYLLARAAGVSVTSQLASYAVERMFDVGAAAVICLGAVALDGRGIIGQQVSFRIGASSVMAIAAFATMTVTIRQFGESAAVWLESQPGPLSQRSVTFLAGKLRIFRQGLHTVHSFAEFMQLAAYSLLIWGLVGLAYVQVVHAFVQTPELLRLSLSQTMLLLAASIGGSLVQLPVIGWFTQIAATAATMHALLQVPIEAATACGALLLGVTFLFLIPGGLIFAHLARVSVRSVMLATETLDC